MLFHVYFPDTTNVSNRHINWNSSCDHNLRTYETATHINVAPAKPCTKPEEEISIEVYAGWVADLTWISRRDRGMSHAFSCVCNSHFCVAAGGKHMTPFAMLQDLSTGLSIKWPRETTE